MIRNKQQLRDALDRLIMLGVVADYEIHSRMPGLRWVVRATGQGQGTSFTSRELDAWLDGAIAGYDAGRLDREAVDELEHFVLTPEWSVSMLEDIADVVRVARPKLWDTDDYDDDDDRVWRSH